MDRVPSLSKLSIGTGTLKRQRGNNVEGLQLQSEEYFWIDGPGENNTHKAYIYPMGNTTERIQPLFIQWSDANGDRQIMAAFKCTHFVTNVPNSWLLAPCLGTTLLVMERKSTGEHRFVFKLYRVRYEDVLMSSFPSKEKPRLQVDAHGAIVFESRSYKTTIMPFDTGCNDPEGYRKFYEESKPFPSANSYAEEYGNDSNFYLPPGTVGESCLFNVNSLDGACAYLIRHMPATWNKDAINPPPQIQTFEEDSCNATARSYCQELSRGKTNLDGNKGFWYSRNSYPTHRALAQLYGLHSATLRWKSNATSDSA